MELKFSPILSMEPMGPTYDFVCFHALVLVFIYRGPGGRGYANSLQGQFCGSWMQHAH